jgi:hypothetical protein
MKHLFAFLFMALFLFSCRTFEVVIKDDKYKKATIVSVDMWHKVIDSRIDNQRVIYEKEINNGKVSIPTASFFFSATINPVWGYNGEDIEKEAIMLCDDKNINVKFMDYKRTNESTVIGSQSYDTRGNPIGAANRVNSSLMSGKIFLTPDIQKAIKNCKSYSMRFYVGHNPLTLQASPEQLAAVKKFLDVNASDAIRK